MIEDNVKGPFFKIREETKQKINKDLDEIFDRTANEIESAVNSFLKRVVVISFAGGIIGGALVLGLYLLLK